MSFLAWKSLQDPFVQIPFWPLHHSFTSSYHFGLLMESSSCKIAHNLHQKSSNEQIKNKISLLKLTYICIHHFELTSIDEFPGILPFEVTIVKFVIWVEELKIFCQLCRRSKLINMNVRVERSLWLIVFWSCAHLKSLDDIRVKSKLSSIKVNFTYNNWQDIAHQCIAIGFFCYIITAIGVLERQIKLVFFIEHFKTLLSMIAGAFEVSTGSINIYLDVLWEFFSVC